MEKIGLVLEGGGMRGAYTSGALAWLNDHNITFDYNVGISSGAVYLCCYLEKDKHTPYNMSVHYAAEPDVVGVKALMRCGYYVDYAKIFKDDLLGKEHMSVKDIREQKMNVEVGAYVLEHGKTEFFGPEDIEDDLTVLNGSCALPVASAIVEYKGLHLLDGGITKMIPIERAMEKGCTKYFIITTKPADYVRKPSSKILKFMMKRIYKEYPQVAKDYGVRHLNYYHQMDIIHNLVNEGKALYILPTRNIPVSRFKGDVEHTQMLYDLGYQDMEDRKDEIFAFLKKTDE